MYREPTADHSNCVSADLFDALIGLLSTKNDSFRRQLRETVVEYRDELKGHGLLGRAAALDRMLATLPMLWRTND